MALSIQEWYYNLPYRHFQKMRQTICTQCLVTPKIVYYWMNSYTKIPYEYHQQLIEIVRDYHKINPSIEIHIEFNSNKEKENEPTICGRSQERKGNDRIQSKPTKL